MAGWAHCGWSQCWTSHTAHVGWLGSRNYVERCVWAMQKGQLHLSVKWGRSWSACRCTECSSWRHWSFNSWNQGNIDLSTPETRDTTACGGGSLSADGHRDHPQADTLSAAQQAHSANISLRSSGLLSRKLLPEIWCHMKSWSCHHSRVKLTTVFEPMDVLDSRGPEGWMFLVSRNITGKVVGECIYFVCWLGSLFCCSFCTETNNLWN